MTLHYSNDREDEEASIDLEQEHHCLYVYGSSQGRDADEETVSSASSSSQAHSSRTRRRRRTISRLASRDVELGSVPDVISTTPAPYEKSLIRTQLIPMEMTDGMSCHIRKDDDIISVVTSDRDIILQGGRWCCLWRCTIICILLAIVVTSVVLTTVKSGTSSASETNVCAGELSVTVCLRARAALSALYVFGDDFADVGNVYSATNESVPSDDFYFEGRFTNGRNWADFTAQALGLSMERNVNNFAWGGAKVNQSTTLGQLLVPSVTDQISTFANGFESTGTSNETVLHQHLFAASGGKNDLWEYAMNQTNPTEEVLDGFASAIASDVAANVLELLNLGARRLIVFNIPESPILGNKDSATVENYNKMAITFNSQLSNKIGGVVASNNAMFGKGVAIVILDMQDTMSFIRSQPPLGFQDIDSACLTDFNNTNATIATVCKDPFGSVFWDEVGHITTHTHNLISAAVLDGSVLTNIKPSTESTVIQSSSLFEMNNW